MSFVIMTDSSADLPWNYYSEHGVHCLKMAVVVGNDSIYDDENLDAADFYQRLRNGEVATTSQISVPQYTKAFEEIVSGGQDVILLGLSLALSNSYSSACVAAADLKTRYPERKIYVCDTTCVTLGLGMLVDGARKLRDEGADFETICSWAERIKYTIQHRFNVEDLMFLHRGGRISRSSAIVGSLIGIKPLLHVSKSGKLESHGKTRGRKSSLLKLAEDYTRLHNDQVPADIYISHGDCEEDARFVVDEIKKHHPVRSVTMRYLGSTIGAHSGPGTVALFFLGKEEREADQEPK